jgi:hypothetical protein
MPNPGSWFLGMLPHEAAWAGGIAAALLRIGSLLTSAPAPLPRLTITLEADHGYLARVAAPDVAWQTGQIHRDARYRMADALLSLQGKTSEPCTLWLAAVALELYLRRPDDRDAILLMSICRAVWNRTSRGPSIWLMARLEGVATLDDLCHRLDEMAAGGVDPPHKDLAHRWPHIQSALGQFAAETAIRDRRLLAFNPKDRFTSITLGGPGDGSGPREDDGAEAELFAVDDATRAGVAEGKARWLGRYISAAPFRHPDTVLPVAPLSHAYLKVLTAAEDSLEAGRLEQARNELVLALALITGVDEGELQGARVSEMPAMHCVTIAPAHRAMFRPERRPENSFKAEGEYWNATGGPIVQALPDRLALAFRSGFPDGAIPGGVAAPSATFRRLFPSSSWAFSDARRRHSSWMARERGLDVSQLFFGDALSAPPTGTYYARISAADLARAAWRHSAMLCAEDPDAFPAEFAAPEHFVGSRASPTGNPIADWTEAVSNVTRNPRDIEAQWDSARDRAARALIAYTGHRPTRALASLTVHDLVASHRLYIAFDKQVDPQHQTRLVSAPGLVWDAISDLLRVIIGVERSGRASAGVAASILAGASPLLSTGCNETGNEIPLDVLRLFENAPPVLRGKKNLCRHVLAQFLIAREVPQELRYQQMGWLVPVHATCDCSPYSPAEFASRIGPALDTFAGKNARRAKAAADPWDSVPLPPLQRWTGEIASHIEAGRVAAARLRQAVRERRREVLAECAPRLHKAIRNRWGLEVGYERSRAHLVLQGESPRAIDAEAFEQVIRDALPDDHEAVVEYSLREELGRLVRHGVRAEVLTEGFTPPSMRISSHVTPSPFIRGLGRRVGKHNRFASGCSMPAGGTPVNRGGGSASAPFWQSYT